MEGLRALEAYERCLCNQTGRLTLKGTSIKQPQAEKQAELEQNARDIIRYSVIRILGWTAKDAYERMTPEIAKKLRYNEIARYMSFPNGVKRTDYAYMIQAAFPADIKVDSIKQLIDAYKEILSGKELKFPRYAFDQDDGEKKAGALLFYYINNYMAVKDIPSLYELFGNSRKACAILRKAHLSRVCSDFYDSPLDYFHFSLSPSQRDEFEYSCQVFKNMKVPEEKKEERAGDAAEGSIAESAAVCKENAIVKGDMNGQIKEPC